MQQPENPSFTFEDVSLAPDRQIGLHEQSTWEVSYIITGSGMQWLDNCRVAFPELRECVERLKQKRNAVKFGKKKAAVIVSILEEMRGAGKAERIPPMIRLLLLLAGSEEESIVGRHRQRSPEQERMERIQVYVTCNARQEITLDDIARHVGMNRTSFCIFFKKATGKTFVTYLNEYRIELACRLLKQQKDSVAEICYQAGFNNVPYFNRVFKKLKGVAPSEYAARQGSEYFTTHTAL